jgi:hypothetical protein
MAIHARWCIALALLAAGCTREPRARAEPAPALPPVATTGTTDKHVPVNVTFDNVHLRVGYGAVLEVRHLEGALLSTDAERPPIFDDQRSFTLRVDTGRIAMTPGSLTALLNGHVLAFEGSPLSDVEVSIEGSHLKQSGTLHKGVPIPFSMLAELSATSDGRVRLHPIKVKAAGIPSGGLMKAFGVELDDLVKSNRAHGIEIVDDDLLLSPDRLLPAPALKGQLTGIRIEGDRIVQEFGHPASGVTKKGEPGNYMRYRGGTLRFGKLTMSDTDMQLIDADPRDPFDFSPAQYVRQLVAGYSKNTPEGGLRVYMPDFNEASKANLKPGR